MGSVLNKYFNSKTKQGSNMYDKEKLQSILKLVTIFAGIDDKGIEQICSKCDIVKRDKGDILIEEDTEATEIFIILKGKAKIFLNMKEEPLELLELSAGNCVGEASVIGIQKHSATAVIIEDSEVLVLSREVLMDLYANDKDLFSLLILNIARELARRLYQTDQTLVHYEKASHK